MSIINAFLSGGGGGLEYETGTFTPTSDTTSKTVNFSKTHTKPPAIFLAFDASGTRQGNNAEYQQITEFLAVEIYAITNVLWSANMSTPNKKGYVGVERADSSSGSTSNGRALQYGSSDTSQTGSSNATRYYLKEASATIYFNSDYKLKANVKMMWLAIWLPDSWTPPA